MPSKWKKAERRPRKYGWTWLNRPHKIDLSFDLPSKVAVFGVLMVLLILGSSATYYYTYGPGGKPGGPLDPFTTMWNGSWTNVTQPGVTFDWTAPILANNVNSSNQLVNVVAGEVLILNVRGIDAPCTPLSMTGAYTDTSLGASNLTWTGLACDFIAFPSTPPILGNPDNCNGVTLIFLNSQWWTKVSVTGQVNVTIIMANEASPWPSCTRLSPGAPVGTMWNEPVWGWVINAYSHVLDVVDPFSCQTNGMNPHPLSQLTFTCTNTSTRTMYSFDRLYWDYWITGKNHDQGFESNACKPLAADSGDDGQIRDQICDSGFTVLGSYLQFATFDEQTDADKIATIKYGPGGINGPYFDAELFSTLLLIYDGKVCPEGWDCINFVPENILSSGLTRMLDRGDDYSSVAISHASIDTSVAVEKELAFSNNFGHPLTPQVGRVWGWYLTTNATLPISPNDYDPLEDTNVVLAVVHITQSAAGVTNNYVFLSRKIGISMLEQAGLSEDSYPNCPESSSIFMCSQTTWTNSAILEVSSLRLNFTGGVTPGSTTAQISELCTNKGGGGGTNCDMGGSQNTAITISNTDHTKTQTFPWINANNRYHYGIFMKADSGGSSYSMRYVAVAIGISVPIISYFVPAATARANTDTGSFFGWLGSTLGGAWNTITGAVGGVINTIAGPVFNIGNALLGAFVSALIQAVTLLVQGMRIFLNAVGNLFGIGNIGDAIVDFFVGIGNFLINAVVTLFSWLINTTASIVGFVTFLASFVVNGFLATITTFIIGPLLTLFGILWTVAGIFFQFSVPVSFILFLDWVWGMFQVYINGVRGWLRWINFNIMATTKIFMVIYWLVIEAIVMMERIINFFKGWI